MSYMSIDDDHIDDQETINVGNLIIDLESDLEKEKIENEQASVKPSSFASTTKLSTASSSSSSSSSSNTLSTPSVVLGAHQPSSSTSSNSMTNPSAPNGRKLSQKSNTKNSNNISAGNNNNILNVNNNNASNSNNNGHVRSVFKSSSDERGELKMRITRETRPGKSEHKIVTSPNQKSPTSSLPNNKTRSGTSNNIINNNNNNSNDNSINNVTGSGHESGRVNDDEDAQSFDATTGQLQATESISSTKECGTSTSIGTITEPDCLGPCEPGTSVTLEGIVWQETDGGILVVNITWRGKTYVGALLDCTKHDWAPPRLCDSPASDIDSKANKSVRTKRIVTRSNGITMDEKNLLQTTGKLRNGKGRRILPPNDQATCNKRLRESEKTNENTINAEAGPPTADISPLTNSEIASAIPMNIENAPATNEESTPTSNISTDKTGPNSPMLIGCSEPNCSKKYRNRNGLLYHQAHAHGTETESSTAQDGSCQSPNEEKLKSSSKTPGQSNSNTVSGGIELENPVLNSESNAKKFPIVPDSCKSPISEISTAHGEKASSDSLPIGSTTNQQLQNFPQVPMIPSFSQQYPPMPQMQQPVPPLPQHPHLLSGPHIPQQQVPPLEQELKPPIVKMQESERRNSSNSNHSSSGYEPTRRTPPTTSGPRLNQEQGLGSSNHSHLSKPINSSNSGSSSKHQSQSQPQPQPPPLPVPTEEGMKPSGTSTGPPPAPHQANYYFNSALLANPLTNPYSLAPYLAKPPLPPPLFDPLGPQTSSANAAFLSRFMSSIRGPPPLPTQSQPPPEAPSRLLSPSMPKNLPFPPYRIDHPPGPLQIPNIPPPPPPQIPGGLPPMQPIGPGSPHLRVPSQGDHLLPPNVPPPPFAPPAGLNPALTLPGGPPNPMLPLGGPQMPGLADDQLAKFPRFN